MRLIKTLLITFTAIVIMVAALGAAAYYYNLPPETVKEDTIFNVYQGEPFRRVAERLESEGLIRSSMFFKILGRYNRTEKRIKTGLYEIPAGSDSRKVHDILVSGREILHKATIPEGWTSTQIAGYMNEYGFCSAEDFLSYIKDKEIINYYGITADSLEGYLFPDTYYMPKGISAKKAVMHMVDNFFIQLKKITGSELIDDRLRIHEKVILASIVEREYRVDKEAPLIASVFLNRLKIGMPLQSCATVAYVLSEIQGKPYPERLFYRDLEIDSPYNTYKFPGLPLGPISNPGKRALESVFNPAKSDFLFFVLRDGESGEHHFSKTLSEHSQAYSLFIKKQ